MAEVNTNIYQPYKQPENSYAAMGPLQIMQLIGHMNQNALFQQEYGARKSIGEAYKRNTLPGGEINVPGLRSDIGQNAGFRAGEALQQATSNSSADLALKSGYQDVLRKNFGTLSGNPKGITDTDIARAHVAAAAQGIPAEAIQEYVSQIPRNPAQRKEWAATQLNLTRSPDALAAGRAGPIGEGGIRPEITEAEATLRRSGINPEAQNAGVPKTGMAVQLPIGEEEQMKAGVPMRAAAQERAAKFADEMQPIESAISALERLGPNATAPGKEDINRVRSFIQGNLSWIPGADKIAGNVETTQDFDELAKYMKQIGGGIARNFGHGTDQAATLGLSASPNTGISTLANKDLLKVTAGLRRMEQARELDAQRQGIPTYKYPSWAAKWASNVDPRAFMVDKLDDAQWERVKKTLNTPEKRKKFNMSIKTAVDTGLIDPSIFNEDKT